MKFARVPLVAFGVLLGSAAALAQFTDGFEAYNNGPLTPQGGWQIWYTGGDDGTVIDTSAHTGAKSLRLDLPGGAVGGTDVVQTFNIAGGQWAFSAWTYVPSNAGGILNRDGYLIFLNNYNGQPNPVADHWSMQVRFSATQGVVESQFDGGTLPLIYDQWVEFRVYIDLVNDKFKEYYGGQLLATNLQWTTNVSGGNPPGTLTIACLDLYSDSIADMLIDDVSLQPVVLCPGDINGDNQTCQADLGILLSKYGCCEVDPCWDSTAVAANLSPGDTGGACGPLEEGITQADLGVLLADYGCGGCQ
ncbi:MAG TPA: hypothetical protein PKC49_13020 [Phycisphaerae bacterium]|nr:hypothetical protein [Phycisphaerae bacterium]